MKKRYTYTIITLLMYGVQVFSQSYTNSHESKNSFQKSVYTVSTLELLLQHVPSAIVDEKFDRGVHVNYFFNFVGNAHIDFSRYVGLMPGISIRNVGIKTMHETVQDIEYQKIIRRAYMAGLSGSLKFGNISKFSFAYIGGAYEIPFHYRQRYFQKNIKIIRREWGGNATEQLHPSLFAGYQFSNGLNIQVRHYLRNFLNPTYNGVYGDFSQFTDSKLFQVSISVHIRESDNNSGKIRDRILQPLTEI